MSQEIPADIQKLIDIYTIAQENLVKTIAEKEAKGSIAAYQKLLSFEVFEILQDLDNKAKKWSKDVIPSYYQQGIDDAIQGLKDLGQDVDSNSANFNQVHEKAVQSIVNSCYGDLNDANNYVGRRINDAIRQAGLDVVANKFATGQTVRECKNNLVNTLINEGINGIKDKRGRNISLDAYASTVARSTTREATNKAKTTQLTSMGYDLVKMSSHATTCPLCSMYQGRVYSISGKDSDYPPLDTAFSGDYANIHPNCRHVLIPYIRDLDNNADDLQEYSNRPFEIAEKDRKAIDDYNKQQVAKRQLRTDRQQYQNYRLALPDDTPKSFADFRQMKYNDTDKWNLFKDFAKSRKNNMIPALVSFKDYTKYKNLIDKELVGITTINGIKITGQSKHFIERLFGTTQDPHTNRYRNGVDILDIKEALLNGVIRTRKNDPDSIKFITDKCIVSVNPHTGNLIQVNPQ